MESVRIIRIRGGDREWVEDLLTEEVPLKLVVRYEPLVTLLCSPQDLEDLIRGFLYTSGLIDGIREIGKLVINHATWMAYIDLPNLDEQELAACRRAIGSGCGGGGQVVNPARERRWEEPPGRADNFRVDPPRIQALMKDFMNRSTVHRQTGGVHGAALADRRGIGAFREDIGRHNAIDKVIGYALARHQPLADKILLTSGRVSSEVLSKLMRCGLPILISRGAPTARSVRLAREGGVTLVGFARGERMNIYSGEARIGL